MYPCETDHIQDAELAVLQVLWEAGEPLPLSQLLTRLRQSRGWADSTVKTLLRRLQQKGAVTLPARGVYTAAVEETSYHSASNQRFLDKLYRGSAKSLVAALVQEGRLTAEDIAELTALLEGEVPHD